MEEGWLALDSIQESFVTKLLEESLIRQFLVEGKSVVNPGVESRLQGKDGNPI